MRLSGILADILHSYSIMFPYVIINGKIQQYSLSDHSKSINIRNYLSNAHLTACPDTNTYEQDLPRVTEEDALADSQTVAKTSKTD